MHKLRAIHCLKLGEQAADNSSIQDMSETDSSSPASQYIHNVRRAIETANIDTHEPSGILAAVSLAETYLSFDLLETFESEFHSPTFFLHILWCNPTAQGIEQAARELEILFGDSSTASQVNTLTALQNVLLAIKKVPSICESLRNSCNIDGLFFRAILYGFFTSSVCDLDEEEEWDCLDIFLSEVWNADNEELQQVAASNLQAHIENFPIEPSESVLEALLEGRITTPNTLWDNDRGY